MERDLGQEIADADWLVEKIRGSADYAQHLYAALCNNEFQKAEVWPMLKGEVWSCTWRTAGGIISEIKDEGSYLDWYCSGMAEAPRTVAEGVVTDEIRADLRRLGWTVIDQVDDV